MFPFSWFHPFQLVKPFNVRAATGRKSRAPKSGSCGLGGDVSGLTGLPWRLMKGASPRRLLRAAHISLRAIYSRNPSGDFYYLWLLYRQHLDESSCKNTLFPHGLLRQRTSISGVAYVEWKSASQSPRRTSHPERWEHLTFAPVATELRIALMCFDLPAGHASVSSPDITPGSPIVLVKRKLLELLHSSCRIKLTQHVETQTSQTSGA